MLRPGGAALRCGPCAPLARLLPFSSINVGRTGGEARARCGGPAAAGDPHATLRGGCGGAAWACRDRAALLSSSHAAEVAGERVVRPFSSSVAAISNKFGSLLSGIMPSTAALARPSSGSMAAELMT